MCACAILNKSFFFVCLLFVQGYGGGLYILGTATLTNTNVYENDATMVRLRFEPS